MIITIRQRIGRYTEPENEYSKNTHRETKMRITVYFLFIPIFRKYKVLTHNL